MTELLQPFFVTFRDSISLGRVQRVNTPIDQVYAHAHVVVDVEAVVGVHLDGGELVLPCPLLLSVHPVLEKFRAYRNIWLGKGERVSWLEIPVCLFRQLELVISFWRAVLLFRRLLLN